MKPGNFLKYFILAVIAINVAILAAAFLPGLKTKPVPLPNPNGYDDFVKAGQSLVGTIGRYYDINHDDLAKLVAENEPASKLLHLGITRDSRIPIDYSRGSQTNMFTPLISLKQCSQLFSAEARLAELEGRTNDAAQTYLDLVQYGQSCTRGGVIIDRLVGVAIEMIGLRGLQSLSQNLPASLCAEAARKLEAIDAAEESPEEMLVNERHWKNRTMTLRLFIAEIRSLREIHVINQKCVAKLNTCTNQRRKVMLTFAARAYELNQGHRPAKITDLVPTYLKAIPQDPITGNNLALTAIPN